MNFEMPGKVYGIAMSPVATSHMLIAAGTEDVQVRLCDIASGAFTHTLSGHRGKMIDFDMEFLLILSGSFCCTVNIDPFLEEPHWSQLKKQRTPHVLNLESGFYCSCKGPIPPFPLSIVFSI